MPQAATQAKRLSAETGLTNVGWIRRYLFVGLALLALGIRLPQLGVRPMHTDEAINGYLTGQLLGGEPYHYDPQDRHGPALVELTLPLVRLEGAQTFADLTEAQLRLAPVLAGSATVLLLGAAVETFGFIPSLVAALLFAFAPLPVYYSRYFIHETLFVAATLGLVLSGARALRKKSMPMALLTGCCAALMLASKETAGLHFVALGLAAAIGWQRRTPGTFPPLRLWLATVISFLVAGVWLFTWGGHNWSALADLFRAIPHLAARAGGEGHDKPCWYYLVLLAGGWSGALVLGISLLGICRTPRSTVRITLAIYTVLIYATYCAIPYKTPWLALNLWLPLTLLAGFAVEWIWSTTARVSGRAAILIGGGALGLLIAHDTRQRVFQQPTAETNPYAYAHTTQDVMGLPGRLKELDREHNHSHPRIAVIAADAWPLPWYLRSFSHVGFWQPNQDAGEADYFITTTEVADKLTERLKTFRPEFFGVRPNVLLILWAPPKSPPGHE